jgi:hypothetical protein
MNKVKITLLIAIIIPFINLSNGFAQGPEFRFNLSDLFPIQDFKLSADNGLTIDAIDKNGDIDVNIEGIYTFVVNGYIEKLNFKKGRANLNSNFNKSEVFYIKHERQLNTLRHLYYSIAGFAIKIPLWLFILIPVLIILFAVFVKRLLFFLLLIGFILFFITQGLDISAFINLVKESFQYFKI